MSTVNILTRLAVVAVASCVILGCSKKEDTSPEASATPAPETAKPADAAAAAAQPQRAAAPPKFNQQKAYSEADEALKSQNYEGAVDAVIKVELSNPQMTPEQRVSHINKRHEIQLRIAQGLASGDPKAIKAAELLRRAQPR